MLSTTQTPLSATYTDSNAPQLDYSFTSYFFGTSNPINQNKLNISTNTSDETEIQKTEYRVYDGSNDFFCDNSCFEFSTTNNLTHLNQLAQWKYLFHLTNGTNTTPINLSLSGNNGSISGIFYYGGSIQNITNASLYIINANSTISYFILKNSTGDQISYLNTSTFAVTNPFGKTTTLIMNSQFNVSNSIFEGNYQVNITSYDYAGNANTMQSSIIFIDETPPTVISAALSDDYVQNNTQVILTVNISDNNMLNVTSASLNLTNTSNIWTGSSYLLGSSSSINLTASDKLNNSVNFSVNYTIDNTSPLVNLVTLNDYVVQSGSSLVYSVNVSGESNTTIQSVTAEGNALSWNSVVWTGSGSVDNDSIVNITVIDRAENNASHSSTSYTTDDALPTISAYIQGTIISNPVEANQSILLLNTSDNINLSNTYYILDGNTATGINSTVFSNHSSSSTQITFNAGRHILEVYANDSAGNTNSSTLVFYSSQPINATQWNNTLTNHLLGQATSINLAYANGSSLNNPGNETIANTTYELNMTTNSKAILVSVRNFSGLSTNWDKMMNITDNNRAEGIKSSIESLLSTNLDEMLYANMNGFLANASDYYGTARFLLNASLYTSIWYFENESDLSAYTAVAGCSGQYNPGSSPCYTVDAIGRSLVYVPHFSIITVNNDTTGPSINISSPLNSSTFNQSYGIVLAAATPETSNCNYTWSTGASGLLGTGAVSFSKTFNNYHSNADYSINIT